MLGWPHPGVRLMVNSISDCRNEYYSNVYTYPPKQHISTSTLTACVSRSVMK